MKNNAIILSIFLTFCGVMSLITIDSLQSKNPVTIFCHGVVDNYSQIDNYNKKSIFGDTCSFDFPDATPCPDKSFAGLISQVSRKIGRTRKKPNGKNVNLDQMFLGQDQDLECLRREIEAHRDRSIILYGASRGGAAVVSWLGQAHDTSNIIGVVLEAPPTDMLDTVIQFSAKLGIRLSEQTFRSIFHRYPENPYRPIDAIRDIKNKNLPIFITHSAEDVTVNPSQPWILYQAFKEAGFTNVYINEIETGRHCHLHLKEDFQEAYCEPIKAFYQKYNFFTFVEKSDVNLDQYQPTIEIAQHKITQYQEERKQLYLKNKRRNKVGIVMTALSSFLLFLL